MEKKMQDQRDEKIRLRAYQIWEQEGRPEGKDIDHWHRADSEIEQEQYQMQAEQDSRPSDTEETESATQAVRTPEAPPALSTNQASAKRQRAPLSGSVAENNRGAARSKS
jgi:biotin carboxyl carrier protein